LVNTSICSDLRSAKRFSSVSVGVLLAQLLELLLPLLLPLPPMLLPPPPFL
jgi:hypothetical protein